VSSAPSKASMRDRLEPIPRLSLSASEAAAAVGVSRDTFDEYIAGDLPWIRVGRRKLVSTKSIVDWLDRNGSVVL
jgi:hypothetical protein